MTTPDSFAAMTSSTLGDHSADTADTAQPPSARQLARLAIARWTNGATRAPGQVEPPAPPTAQARWYADAQANLQHWIANGGFSQPYLGADCPAILGRGNENPAWFDVAALGKGKKTCEN